MSGPAGLFGVVAEIAARHAAERGALMRVTLLSPDAIDSVYRARVAFDCGVGARWVELDLVSGDAEAMRDLYEIEIDALVREIEWRL